MSLLTWIVIVVVAWLAVAAAVGAVVGRSIRLRDRQVPVRVPSPRLGRWGHRAEDPSGVAQPPAPSHGQVGDHRG